MAQEPKKKKKKKADAAASKKVPTKSNTAKNSAVKQSAGRKVTPAAAGKSAPAKKTPAKKTAPKAVKPEPLRKPRGPKKPEPPPPLQGETNSHCQDQLVVGSDGQLRVRVLNPRFSALWTAPPPPADPNPTLDQYIVMVNGFLRDGNVQPPFALSICIEVAGQDISIDGSSTDLLNQLAKFLLSRLDSVVKVCTCS